MLITPADMGGSDVFYTVHQLRSDDLGKTWTRPEACQGLERVPLADNPAVEIVPCDMVPGWHAKTGKLLALGTTNCYRPGQKLPIEDNSQPMYASYSVYENTAQTWSAWKYMELPDMNHFYWAAAGTAQRVDLPNGDILWPMYVMDRDNVGENFWKSCFFTTVVRCSFDGTTVKYLEHGDELSVPDVRGLCESSLAKLGERYYLTLRNDLRGYVTASRDGLHFDPVKPWLFDDGTELGSYNTQQHWVVLGEGLFLVYTRRGANNDHIIRHRAPLFMAQVDTEKLCVIRETERILLPNNGGAYGNGGAVMVSPSEAWVTDAETMVADATDPMNWRLTVQRGADNRVYLCKIYLEKGSGCAGRDRRPL
jgi:hypothetical protein